MNASPQATTPTSEAIPDAQPQVTPRSIGLGHPEYNFVAGLMELQKAAVKTEAVLESVQKTLTETKDKVARFEKIVYTATGILVVVVGLGGWMLSSAKDVAMVYIKASIEAQQAKPLPPVAPATPARQRTTP